MDRRFFLAATSLATLFTNAGQAPAAAGSPPVDRLLFPSDNQFWYETLRAIGAGEYGGSSFGEVLVTANSIQAGDVDSWYAAWNATADRVAEEASRQLARGHRVSARDGLLRAATYYQCSDFFLHGSPHDARVLRAYKRSVECYGQAARMHEPAIEPVEIPYGTGTLPGYFHSAGRPGRRPTLILHTGFDGSAEEMHVFGARAAVERGYNVLAFDGPGQYGPLHRDGLVFRPDWENVVGPVVDFALTRPDVDPKRLALMGISLGGLLAPRAAAYEKRLAALIANDGVYDFSATFKANVPPEKLEGFLSGLKADQAPAIDQMLAQQMKTSTTFRWAYEHGMWSTGAASPRAFLAKMLDYNLRNGVAEAITCPTLVCDAEADLFFTQQPQQLYDHLTCRKTLIRFTTAEGAGAHCQVGANRLAFARIFDWLDETLG